MDMRRRNPDSGLVVFWVKLMQRGYSRSITGLYRFLKKQNLTAVHPPNPKYVPKPYEQMIILASVFRWRYVEALEEHSTYSSAMFMDHLVKAFPCRIE